MGLGNVPPNFDTQLSSPAIGAGSTSLPCSVGWCDPNGGSPNSIYGSTDFLGDPRTTGSSIDIGAYQNTGSVAGNTLTVTLSSNTYTLQAGQTATLTTTVSVVPGGAGVPSGTVNYMLGSSCVGNADADANWPNDVGGEYADQRLAASTGRQYDHRGVLGKSNCALLQSIGTAGRRHAGVCLSQWDFSRYHAYSFWFPSLCPIKSCPFCSAFVSR